MGEGSDNWPELGGFDITTEDGDGEETSLAIGVLNVFGISCTGSGGGGLIGIDIKRMDAMQVIQASLFEGMVQGKLYELVSDGDGVAIIEVGGSSANISPVIVEAGGFSYRSEVGGVVVTGGAPTSSRRLGSRENILSGRYNMKIWDDAHYLSSACTMPEMKKFCTITYDDPMLDAQWEDGLGSRFGPDSPFENIVSYEHIVGRGTAGPDVSISFNNKANVPLDIGSSLNSLITPEMSPNDFTGFNEDCMLGLGTEVDNFAIRKNIPSEVASYTLRNTTINKVSGINGVYVIGKQVNYWVTPSSVAEALNIPSSSNTLLWVDFSNANDSVTKLSDGVHYVAGITKGGQVGVSFADRSVFAAAGISGLFGDGKTVFLPPSNPVAREYGSARWDGVSILPIDDSHAILVKRILVSINVDTPCIEIEDPEGNANDIARKITYRIRPIIVKSEPAPVSINGNPVDLESGAQNNDPTVTQDFDNTDYENRLNQIHSIGAGMSFTLSSLSKGQTNTLSSNLHSLYNQDNGISNTYTCGPELNIDSIHPGMDSMGGGVVNRVEARYTDSTSYLVTVSDGPKSEASNFSSLSGATHIKRNEDVSGTGIVIQDSGNGSRFKVLVDGIGPRNAINTTSDVVREGDRVGILIRNNPVES